MIAVTRDGNGPIELNGFFPCKFHPSFARRAVHIATAKRAVRELRRPQRGGNTTAGGRNVWREILLFYRNRVYALVGDARYSLRRSCTLASLQALVARPALSIFVTSQRLIVGVRRRAALHTRARGARAATRAARARRAVPGRGRGRGRGRGQGRIQGQGPGPGPEARVRTRG